MVSVGIQYTGDHAGEFKDYKPMVAAVDLLKQHQTKWHGLILLEGQYSIDGIADEKTELKREMADYWGGLALTASSYANFINKKELIASWNYTKSSIFWMNETDAVTTCENLFTSITKELANLVDYKITDTLLDAGKVKTENYKKYSGKIGSKTSSRSAIKVEIAEHIKGKINPIVNSIKTLAKGHYFDEYPTFQKGIANALKIHDLPSHSTELSVKFYAPDGMTPISKVKLSLVGTDKFGMSDVTGLASVIEFAGGKNLAFLVEHPDYETVTIHETIKQGKSEHLNLQLKP